MLRKIRTIAAVVCFVALTLLFLDFSGVLHLYLGWLAKLQFLPAVLAGNVLIVAVVLLLTLLFGRIYCSVLCPLGVMQDGFNFIARKVKKSRFHFVPQRRWMRYPLLLIFVVLLLTGFNALAILIAPYSAYGRIAANLLQPLYLWVNNLLATLAERAGSYAFYHVDVWLKSLSSLVIAAATFVVVGALALHRGRTWCNTVCPVGTVLGLVSRVALFRPVINADKCKGCHQCGRNCKASCIDTENKRIDYSRCVACMDCISDCHFGAIQYVGTRFRLNPMVTSQKEAGSVDTSRRKFLSTSALVAGAAALHAQEKKVDGGLAAVADKKIPHRDVALKPAGSVSLKHFGSHCTACQLCVSECPSQVLRPSGSLQTLMQPEMSFERGFCRIDCTRCGDVCPADAIRPVTPAEKSDIHIGFAVVVPDNCVAYKDVRCGNCARHCPAEAIVMVPLHPDADPNAESTVRIPTVDTERCLGCGACEYLCPARPFSAIYVTGREVHQ